MKKIKCIIGFCSLLLWCVPVKSQIVLTIIYKEAKNSANTMTAALLSMTVAEENIKSNMSDLSDLIVKEKRYYSFPLMMVELFELPDEQSVVSERIEHLKNSNSATLRIFNKKKKKSNENLETNEEYLEFLRLLLEDFRSQIKLSNNGNILLAISDFKSAFEGVERKLDPIDQHLWKRTVLQRLADQIRIKKD